MGVAAEGGVEHGQGEVQADHRGPAGEHPAGEDAAAAAGVEDALTRLRVEQLEQQLGLIGVHQSADGRDEPAVVGFGPGVEGGGGHRQPRGDRGFPGLGSQPRLLTRSGGWGTNNAGADLTQLAGRLINTG